jgi:hypothetical protein
MQGSLARLVMRPIALCCGNPVKTIVARVSGRMVVSGAEKQTKVPELSSSAANIRVL